MYLRSAHTNQTNILLFQSLRLSPSPRQMIPLKFSECDPMGATANSDLDPFERLELMKA